VKLIVDTNLAMHPRVLKCSHAAMGTWLLAGVWLAKYPQQGELIPAPALHMFGTPEQAEELVRAGLWRRTKGGYRMLREVTPADGNNYSQILWGTARDDYRRKIPDDVRRRVMERDESRCTECGGTDDLSLDHVYPWSLGGPDTEDNLRVLCRSCNSRKGARV
jgi:hypothetical protein